VDEVVVVDTGSSDETRAVARRSGARVIEADWPGDLGTAHGLPLAHARGDWVLSLDADEVLDPGTRGLIRDLASSDDFDAYELLVRNYLYRWPSAKWRRADPRDPLTRGAAGYVPTTPVRLFRNRPEYTYYGRVHQTIKPSIVESGGWVGTAKVSIHHYGFVRFDRDKSDLYRRLARRHAEEHPDDPRAWIDLGVTLFDERRQLAAAADAFRRARSVGDQAAASFLLGSTLLELGYAADSLPLLTESIRHNPRDESPFYDRADAWEALALAEEELGRPEEAEHAYRTALRIRPDSPAAAVNLAGLLTDRGSLDAAEALLQGLKARYSGSSPVWSTAGVVHLRRGELDAAQRAFEIAGEIFRPNLAALLNLALTHSRAGHPRKAARAYAAAAERLGREEASRLGLEGRLPDRYRRPRQLRRSYGRDLVVSVIPTLGGGGGRVLVDGVLALRGRPQVVVCGEAGPYDAQGLLDELSAVGVEVVTVPSDRALDIVLQRVQPSVVLHHRWNHPILSYAHRVADERWICVGHGSAPMPFGYDAYVSISKFQRRAQAHLSPERVTLIRNGIDLSRFPRTGRRSAGDPVTIAMLSRFDAGKFPRRLLDYLPPLERARVVIAGFGPRRYEIEPEIAAGGLAGRVRFVGPVSSADVPGFLGKADIGLHLTEHAEEEGCPMSVLEMLAAGLPVVAEPRGALPEMVASGENGFLAEEPREVSARLLELIDSSDLRERMGRASRRAAQRFEMGRYRSGLRELVAAVERREPVDGGSRGPWLRVRKGKTARPTVYEWRPRLSYLVCATPRCGGRLLCEALANTGLAGRPGEYFAAGPLRTLSGRWGVDDFDAYLGELFEETSTPNGVFGVKIMADHVPRLLGGLEAFPNPRYVWITRRDKLRQAVSWVVAHQTGLWSDAGEHLRISPPRPRFDRAAIAARLHDIEEAETYWQEFFATAGVEPVHVAYEQLTDDYEGTARRVLAGLGIEIPRDLRIAPPQLVRQASEINDRWVERFSGQAPSRRRSKRRTTSSTVRAHV
jgi:LPS sulfotransferase NodH/glycosyltransferase involved in cell wall biosynthesis